MTAIRPVHMGDGGGRVTDLHWGLIYLIRHQSGMENATRVAMERQLAPEVAANHFGRETADIVGIFQGQVVSRVKAKTTTTPDPVLDKFGGIPMLRPDAAKGNGDVDELTAEALNWLVQEARG